MTSWPVHKLGEFFRIKHGFAFKSAFFAKDGDFIVLTPGNFREDGGLKSQGEKEKYYSTEPPEDFVLKQGDMLVVMTDLTQEARILGSPAVVPVGGYYLHNQRLGKVTDLQEERLDETYLYYLFNWSGFREQLKATATGATVKHTAPDRIYAAEVPLPPPTTQRRIASILSAYDDLIENNTRRIAILEEMARRLYEEWFVHFRFPGHEEATFTETEHGRVPEGWDVIRLDQAIDFNPRTKVPKEGEKLFVPMGALSETGMSVGPLERKSGNSGAKFQNGDTLFARITPCLENGKTGFVDFLPPDQATACGSTEFIVLRSKTLCPEMVYLLSRSDHFRDVAIKSMAGADGRQRVRKESLEELMIAQPEDTVLERFQQVTAPMFKFIRTLNNKNVNLRAQRDLLLPKLVSGEVDVSEAEKTLEGAAA